MEHDIPDPGFDRVATLDIETTHYDPAKGEVVSIGIGVHNVGQDADSIEYVLYHRRDPSVDDEIEIIKQSFGALNMSGADGLVSYNGKDFDLEFLEDRLYLCGGEFDTQGRMLDTHIDLMQPRKQQCRQTGEDWPSLEDCLASYQLPIPKTKWRGAPIDNTRFGDELGPEFIGSLAEGDTGVLVDVIEHYLRTDLEANLALFYADAGITFEPSLLDSHEEF